MPARRWATDEVSDLIQDVTARVILPRFRSLDPDDIEHKRPGDLVTVADREAEAELTRALAGAGVLVVGEEASFDSPELLGRLPAAERAWVVDPVDGTRNFASGSPDFGVMVAEVARGVTLRSWIWQPVHGRLYVGELGGGVTCNGRPQPRLAERARPYRVAAYGALRARSTPGIRFHHTHGSCAIDYPLLLDGGLDVLGYRSQYPWDHLPGALMVTELGGFAGLDRTPYAAGVPGRVLLVAASRRIHDEVDAALRPA